MKISLTKSAWLVALSLIVFPGAPAAATSSIPSSSSAISENSVPQPAIPADVNAWFAEKGLHFVRTVFDSSTSRGSLDGPADDYSSATGIGPAHQMHSWSNEFVAGGPTSKPFVPELEWDAVIESPTGPLGVVCVDKLSPDGPPEGCITGDGEDEAKALARVTSETLVQDAPSGELFTVEGDSVSPLNSSAALECPSTEPLTTFQAVIAKRTKIDVEESKGLDHPMGGTGALVDDRPWYQRVNPLIVGISILIGMLGVAFLILLIFVRIRYRRAG